MKILGIESSCDETAAAVVENGNYLLSNVIQSQIDIHAEYGGVVPEIAARSHLEVINPVVNAALDQAHLSWDEIDAIAYTYAPGLVGALLVGSLSARMLAVLHKKPLYPIHHVEAHVYANFITSQAATYTLELPTTQPQFPLLALIVSGKHTQLVIFSGHGDYTLLGETQDDAIGEAFDKVAKILGLPYPGGPSITRAAQRGDDKAYVFPKSRLKGKYDFSFSGLKTAVLRTAQSEAGKDFTFPSYELTGLLTSSQKHNIAASFQRIAIETLVDKTLLAFNEHSPASVVIAGGVAANQELRRQLQSGIPIKVQYTDPKLCTDNAAMIATLAFYQQAVVSEQDPYHATVTPSLSMTETAWAA